MEFLIALILIQTIVIGILIFAVVFVLNNPTYKEYQSHDSTRDQSIAMLVHELRSPLSIIRGSVDLLLKEAKNLNQDQIANLLNQIDSSTTSQLNIVNDLLDVSKIESGKFEILLEQNDLNNLIKEESHYFEVVANKKNLKLTYVLDHSLKPFEFDSERIKQVLNNLLSNALKFTDPAGVVIITTKKLARSAYIEVADSGIGIPRNQKAKLFHKFAQINQGNNGFHEKGTGLGLVVAKGIVTAHNGKIWVEDNTPKGSKFIFTLPL